VPDAAAAFDRASVMALSRAAFAFDHPAKGVPSKPGSTSAAAARRSAIACFAPVRIIREQASEKIAGRCAQRHDVRNAVLGALARMIQVAHRDASNDVGAVARAEAPIPLTYSENTIA
jgi:hypothetical protein